MAGGTLDTVSALRRIKFHIGVIIGQISFMGKSSEGSFLMLDQISIKDNRYRVATPQICSQISVIVYR